MSHKLRQSRQNPSPSRWPMKLFILRAAILRNQCGSRSPWRQWPKWRCRRICWPSLQHPWLSFTSPCIRRRTRPLTTRLTWSGRLHLLAKAGQKSATVLHAAKEAGREFWQALRSGTKSFQVRAHEWVERGRERVNLRKEEFKMQRVQKAQEQERRRTLEQERAAELEAAREAAAIRLQELLRERGGLTEAQPVPPQKPTAPAPVPVTSAADKAAPGLFGRRIRIPFSRTYRPQLEAVLMGVAAACCFFVLGLLVASFHARPAISSTIQQPSQTQQPYQGVTVKAGTAVPSQVKPGSETRPSSAAGPQSQQPAATTRASDVTVRNFPAPRRQTARRSGNSERLGDDVVIRHFGTPVSAPTQTAPRADLKHYSDLDN